MRVLPIDRIKLPQSTKQDVAVTYDNVTTWCGDSMADAAATLQLAGSSAAADSAVIGQPVDPARGMRIAANAPPSAKPSRRTWVAPVATILALLGVALIGALNGLEISRC